MGTKNNFQIYTICNPIRLTLSYIKSSSYNPVSLNTRAIYNVLTYKMKRAPSCIEKWSENYSGFHTAQTNLWSNIFRLPFSITRETQLQTFQYKLIHLLITCQKYLFDMKLVDNAVCLYCHENDHITYFFLVLKKSNSGIHFSPGGII